MDGFLDELNQAFVTLDFGQGPLDFQIDTGFCGTLVIGEELFDPEWTKQVLGDGKFPVRSNTASWQAGKFIHPHDACFDKAGNLFVVEWVPTGRVTFLRHVS